jgi:hypothetical protein
VSVALVSGAALAYEILLMRLFSISQWHHFAHMTISLALLGFGASGSFLVLARVRLLRSFGAAYVANLCLFGVAAALCFAVARHIQFNPEEVLWAPGQWWGLLLIYLLLALPFFFAANGLGLALINYDRRVTQVYSADLIGAGLGASGTIGLLYLLPAAEVLRVLAICGVAAAAVAWLELRLRSRSLIAALSLTAVGLLAYPSDWSAPLVSQYKSLSQTLRVSGAEITSERSSPLGLLQVVESPVIPLRHVPGLSLNATMEPPEQVGVFTDAGNMTAITRWNGDPSELVHLEYLTSSLPFVISAPRRVLILGAGGGAEVLQALRYRAEYVDAVELNPQMLDLVQGEYGRFSGHIYDAKGVRSHVSEAREFLAVAESSYDLIGLSLTDSFAASSAGLYALNEGYLYTVEALRAYLGRLSPGGFVALTRWIKLPPRDTLKMVATAIDALTASGVAEPGGRLLLIRGLQTSTLVIKNSPVTSGEVALMREFCTQRSFDLAWYPGMPESEANLYNLLQSPLFYAGVRSLLGDNRDAYLTGYKYDLQPATDDRPYFFHFFKWSTLPEVLTLLGRGGTALLDAGYLMLIATLVQALLASAVFILFPLTFLRSKGQSPRSHTRSRVFLYFFLIGLAFLFLEIAFIQKFILFLHHPVYAAAVILTAFLIFAGIGSALSGRLALRYGALKTVQYAMVTLAALGIVYLLVIDLAFSAMISAPIAVKVLATAGLIAPLGLCMGVPFPQALDRVGESTPSVVPWAWAINGCASVVSAVLATLMAIHFGFTAVILAALVLYLLAAAFFPQD